MSLQIFIQGLEMDVDNKTGKLVTTFQNTDFLSLDVIKAAYTNRISLPLTNNNRTILDQIAPLNIISTKPYQNLSIRVIQDGIEIVPLGVCQITGISDRIKLDIQGSIKTFFDALAGLYLTDIDLSAYNGLWDNARHDTVRNTTSGLVCPAISTGQLIAGATYIDGYTNELANLPCLYLQTLIDQIFSLVGFTKDGTIFSANRYLKQVIPTGLTFDTVWLQNKALGLTCESKVCVPSSGNYPRIYNSLGESDFVSDVWEAITGAVDTPYSNRIHCSNADTALKFFSFSWVIYAKVVLTSGTLAGVDLNIRYFDGVTTETYLGTKTTNGPIVVTNSNQIVKVEDGNYFWVEYDFQAGTAGTVSDVTFELIPTNTTETSIPMENDWYWYFNKLLPRIPLIDFMKDFMIEHRLLCSEKNNIVTFKTMEEILTDIAPTETELLKVNKQKRAEISYQIPGWAQANYFRWLPDISLSDDYGQGILEIDNSLLPASMDMYTSIWTASAAVESALLRHAAKIDIFSGSAFTLAKSFGYRKIMLRDSDLYNFRFIAGTDRTDYFIGYFIDKTQGYSLDYQELIDEYYHTYAKVLNYFARVEQEYILSLTDAVEMDLLSLKHKDGITYLIESVEGFVPNKFAKFNMIRILIGS